ncbi:synaptonemal complex central element protein 1 isoform X1 [Alosa sapidissima]|uniref:synaptonemal complex central element protein 1 isoform X1 n=1 Tax=Alosa sapidissima TaxID=34773 RepID=UPI001C09EE3A|nr:synaptonemal complex central element protein 1 isoform X1 [Alosa sapidissima]
MSSSAGFSLDDILMKLSLKQENGKEPKVEDLVVKLRRLQQAKRTLEEELWEVQKIKGVLEQEEEALCSEAFQLDVLLKEKQEAHRVLQFKCEELDQESQRKQEQNKQKEELVEQYRYRIQEATLKHRKTRMKFENQLQQLMVQHKSLFSMFTPQRLPAEIITAENATAQLLKAEKHRMEQLAQQQEELSDIYNGAVPRDNELLTTAV